MRRKKPVYPPAKTATRGQSAGSDRRIPPDRTVTINVDARAGRASIRVGDRVRIQSGLYSGETAIVESAAAGVISAVMVRTESGGVRRARTVDLEPISAASASDVESDASTPAA